MNLNYILNQLLLLIFHHPLDVEERIHHVLVRFVPRIQFQELSSRWVKLS
jgi:hypothetical protein